MNGPAKLAGFAAVLALAFGGAAVAGGAIDPKGDREDTTMTAAHSSHSDTTTTEKPAAGHGAHGAAAPEAGADPDAVRGLAVADDGLRVVVAQPELRRGASERLRFRVVDADGETVRDFDLAHEKRMHLIVARRDLTGFQHLHPEQAADGTWSADVTLPDAGSHRLFADFTREGQAHTLAADLRVDGDADLRALPAPAGTATSDGGETVTLDGATGLRAGRATTLRFAIERDGEPVDVEPYLGASGHLVALRDGDLAFLHVHPSGEGVSFETTFPTAGAYRLFLQVKVGGAVRTAAFTVEVAS